MRAAVVVLAAVVWAGSQVVSPVPVSAALGAVAALATALVVDRVWAWTGGGR